MDHLSEAAPHPHLDISVQIRYSIFINYTGFLEHFCFEEPMTKIAIYLFFPLLLSFLICSPNYSYTLFLTISETFLHNFLPYQQTSRFPWIVTSVIRKILLMLLSDVGNVFRLCQHKPDILIRFKEAWLVQRADKTTVRHKNDFFYAMIISRAANIRTLHTKLWNAYENDLTVFAEKLTGNVCRISIRFCIVFD